MAVYEKQIWVDGETISKEKLDHIEEGIASIELTPGPTGPKGADATINKLNKVDALDSGAEVAAVVTAFNNLIADLKAKGFMNSQ